MAIPIINRMQQSFILYTYIYIYIYMSCSFNIGQLRIKIIIIIIKLEKKSSEIKSHIQSRSVGGS